MGIREMKLRVGICDDEVIFLEKLKGMVSSCLDEMGEDYSLSCFEDGEAVIRAAEELDIIFLDIEMPQMDGIAVGKQLQRVNRDCKIVIASSRIERFKEAFHINALRFVTKPYQSEEIYDALQTMIARRLGLQSIEVFTGRKRYTVTQRSIKYIVAYNGYVEIKAGEHVFRKEASLNEMEECLDKTLFFRIHKKYLINLLWVEQYDNNTVRLEEKEFPISRRKCKEFDTKYMDFDINYR